MKYVLIFCTINNYDKAKEISKILLNEKLIACANIIPKITSIYNWQNNICEDEESLMLLKTDSELFDKVKNTILSLHPYEVPEIISVNIDNGSADYLNWIKNCTK